MPIIVYRNVQGRKYNHCRSNRRLKGEQRKPTEREKADMADILLTCQRRTGSLQEDGSASVFSAYPLTLGQTTDSAFPSFPIPSDRSRGSADCSICNNRICKGRPYKGGIYPKEGRDRGEIQAWNRRKRREERRPNRRTTKKKLRNRHASAIGTAKKEELFFVLRLWVCMLAITSYTEKQKNSKSISGRNLQTEYVKIP